MCDVIRHRGPDDEGVWVDEGVALGMRRLSIIDLSTGHQPIHNEDRAALDRLQRRDLQLSRAAAGARGGGPPLLHRDRHRGHRPRLRAVGNEPRLRRLRGMFAFAIWDTTPRTLLLARDRLGIKPLYYAERERPALVRLGAQVAARGARHPARPRPGRPRSLPVVRLHAARRLDLQGVRKLPPGHLLTWTRRPDRRIERTGELPADRDRSADRRTTPCGSCAAC